MSMISAACDERCRRAPAPRPRAVGRSSSRATSRHSSRSVSRCALPGPITVSFVRPSFTLRGGRWSITSVSNGLPLSGTGVSSRRCAEARRRPGCSRRGPGARRSRRGRRRRRREVERARGLADLADELLDRPREIAELRPPRVVPEPLDLRRSRRAAARGRSGCGRRSLVVEDRPGGHDLHQPQDPRRCGRRRCG